MANYNQSDYENSLVEAINYLVNNRVENIDRDKTITATIVSCSNALTQEYQIQYNNGFLTAYAQDGASFATNETVYVLVPLGDFSKKKTIIGRASGVSDDSNITFVSSLLNDYNMIGKNVIEDPNNSTPIGLNSYLKNDYVLLFDRDLPEESLLTINQDEFASYIQKASALLMEATFQTRLPRTHRLSKSGRYGIQYVLAFKDQAQPDQIKHMSYVLDTNNMTGNPLLYTNYTNQYAIYPIDAENFLYVESILAFSSDFVTEDDVTQSTLWGDDIFIKEFEIYGLQEITATSGDYALRLSTPEGALFNSLLPTDTLPVIGTTTYQKNTDISDSTTYYWFAKDDRVSSSSEDYQMYGGAGWRYLRDMGANKNITLLASENRAYENIYLVVAVYKESVVLKQQFTIYNESARRDIQITSDLGLKFSFDRGTPTLTCLINGKSSDFDINHDDTLYSFAWSKIDDYGTVYPINQTYEELEEQYNQGIIDQIGYSALAALKNQMLEMEGVEFERNVLKYPINHIAARATFSCSVYLRETKDEEDYYVGSAEITLQNETVASPNDYYILIQNGEQVFQYSESGIAPNSDRYTDPLEILPLECRFYDPAGLEINPQTYSVKWVVPLESSMITIPEEGMQINPANNRLEWYTQEVYPMMIKESYDYQALNNQITCIVTYNGQEYQKETDFLFVKVGDNGTNGTDMVGKISPIHDPSDGLLMLELRTGDVPRWNTGYPLASNVLQYELYRRNELLNLESVSWSMAGGNSKSRYMTIEAETGVINWEKKTGNGRYYNNLIVRAQTRMEGQVYYAFYPVPVINYYNTTSYVLTLDKTKTLKNILYNADGRNPLYNKNQGVFFNISTSQSKYIVYTAEGGFSDNNTTPCFKLTFEKDSMEPATRVEQQYDPSNGVAACVYVVPDDIYDGAYCNNIVRVRIYSRKDIADADGNPEVDLWVPIHMSLNTFGLASLNAWDGNHVEINEDENYILAPQIGAGAKDNENKFTGIVMGTAQTYDEDDPTIGLLGYSAGKQSIWLDAETGKAVFGLPEDQASTNNEYTEGRIELVPGGESKIGMWHIGSRALYNMTEPTEDEDVYRGVEPDRAYTDYRVRGAQMSVPPTAQGIILNANPSYISVKGMPLTSDNKSIDWGGANTVLQPGDSLEVELDPSKSSAFSIYRHTTYDAEINTGEWRRYPIVGINANGQFYTNAVENGESNMGIGYIGAFGLSAAAQAYIGAQFGYKNTNIFKFFIPASGSSERTRPLYISTGSTTSNEYDRSIFIHGATINLYSDDTVSTDIITDHFLTMDNDITRIGHNNNFVQIPSSSGRRQGFLMTTEADVQVNIKGDSTIVNEGDIILGTQTYNAIIDSGSSSRDAWTAQVTGNIVFTNFNDLNMQSGNSQNQFRFQMLNSGGGYCFLGNSDTYLQLYDSTTSTMMVPGGLTINNTHGTGVNVRSSSAYGIQLDAGMGAGASVYLHLTPQSGGTGDYVLSSGHGTVRSMSNVGNGYQGVQITPGMSTGWGYFSGTVSGTGESIVASGNVAGSNWLFNQNKSYSSMGSSYSNQSLDWHLAKLYELINTANSNATKAQQTADNATNLANNAQASANAAQSTANAAQSAASAAQGTANSALSTANTANSTANSVSSRFNGHTHVSTGYFLTSLIFNSEGVATGSNRGVVTTGGPR